MHKWIMDHVYIVRMEWNSTEKFNSLGVGVEALKQEILEDFLGTVHAMLFKQVWQIF